MLKELFGYCVRVSDLDRAKRFYGEVLGLPLLAVIERPRYRIAAYAVGDAGEEILNLFCYKSANDVDDVYPHCAFKVDDQAQMRKRLEANGVPIFELAGNYFIKDPDGNNLEISKIAPGQTLG
jgi:catechol 2,3-dioxygenase-like lactoylglutathione lyase family enzyme